MKSIIQVLHHAMILIPGKITFMKYKQINDAEVNLEKNYLILLTYTFIFQTIN